MAKVSYIDENFNTVSLTRKKKAVEYRVKGLRPKSNTKVYINDTEVTEFVLPTDIIQVEFSANNTPFAGRRRIAEWRQDFRNGEKFTIRDPALPGSGSKTIARGRIEYIEIVSTNTSSNIGVANVHLFIEAPGRDTLYNKRDTERVITSNTTFLITDENRSANNRIIAYYPRYSLVNVATANTIQITGKVVNSQIANTLTPGSKIYIVSGEGAGQNATVASYNTSTRTITIQNNWDLVPGAVSNNKISTDDRAMVRFGDLKSDSTGTGAGLIMIPSIIENDIVEGLSYGWRYFRRWNGWHRKFRLFNRGNKISFENDDFAQTVVQTPIPPVSVPTPIPVVDPPKTVDPITPVPAPTLGSTYSSTPFAQTFFVDSAIHPQGVSLLSCKLLFNAKDNEYPVQVQIRPLTGGIPDAVHVLPNGNAFIQPYDIKVLPEATLKQINVAGGNPFSSNTHFSEAFFDKPVYLESGKEYAIVVMTPSPNHKIYISQIGQNLVGTNRAVSSQPYLGVLYKSQGTSTWTASPNEDLCFELTKAVYNTTTPAVVDFYLKTLPDDLDNYGIQGIVDLEQTAPEGTINLHAFYVTNPEFVTANTNITYEFRSTRADGNKDAFKSFELDKTYEFYDTVGSRVLNTANDSFTIRATLSTNNPDIAPSLDFSDLTLMRIENVIDNNSISNSDIFITNVGQDYSNAQNVVVTISGGGGSGATAVANVVNGIVDAIYITNGGAAYTSSPTINISADSTSTITAEAVVIGEDQPNGGVAECKYITKKFTLVDGFKGGDLRVIFSAYKPSSSIIDVYYKVMSEDDFDSFENKRWTQMTLIGGINDNSLNQSDYRKFIYAPGKGNLADNFISYDGFTTFKYFAVKVVMRTIDGTKPPVVRDLRITALAELLT